MVNVKEDLTGKQFGKWIVLKQTDDYIQPSNGKHHAMWLCKCSCKYGTITAVQGKHLKNGKSTKCVYCSREEKIMLLEYKNKQNKKNIIISEEELKIKKQKKRLHSIWGNMKDRCFNKNSDRYYRYGGRGVSICDEWMIFDNFYNWALNNGYQDNLTIDRVNNDGNYTPDNCRWADNITQANNKSNNNVLTYNGESHTLREWSRLIGIDSRTIFKRINRDGWTLEDALNKPIRKVKKGNDALIEFNNKKHNLSNWSKLLNIPRETLKSRLKRGWSVEDAFTTPVKSNKNKEEKGDNKYENNGCL